MDALFLLAFCCWRSSADDSELLALVSVLLWLVFMSLGVSALLGNDLLADKDTDYYLLPTQVFVRRLEKQETQQTQLVVSLSHSQTHKVAWRLHINAHHRSMYETASLP